MISFCNLFENSVVDHVKRNANAYMLGGGLLAGGLGLRYWLNKFNNPTTTTTTNSSSSTDVALPPTTQTVSAGVSSPENQSTVSAGISTPDKVTTPTEPLVPPKTMVDTPGDIISSSIPTVS